ncbi:heat shock protein HSP60 [Fimbriimonas ginsengisoli Gsoil 348]|uniref:Heat shock protein HSP60 n=1 Tax=Fimbriimonas ginsengisoli Gsoil 348 TaxID=661478 RepID=A0A068NJ20_FIMGI|nr:heat shock protein HSP60 [Fimbriimonas ginsengisoli Gsoil 348]
MVPDHPNHLIVLLDASRSMQGERSSSAKRAVHRLLDSLYGSEKLEGLPRFDPAHDLVTVLQFGIDSGGEASTAYRRLKWHDLKKDYLHPQITHEPRVTREQLADALQPERGYNLTALAWARAMALDASQVPSGTRVQRTFVLILSDNEANGGTMAEEAEVLEHFARPGDSAWIRALRRKVGKEYRFVGADGVEEPLFEQEIRAFGKAKPVYLSGYEVLNRARERASAEAAAIPAVGSIDIGWQDEGGPHPTAVVRIDPSEKIRKRFGQHAAARITAGSPNAHGEGKVGEAGDTLESPMKFGSLPGGVEPATVRLAVTSDQPGGWLGTRRADTVYVINAAVPIPGTHTIGRRLENSFLFLLFATVAGTALWLWYSWRAGRHFRLKLPGYGNPILLPALGIQVAPIADEVPKPPFVGGEALRVILPPRWMRRIFYRDATLTLAVKDGDARWLGQTSLEVPVEAFAGDAIATWAEVPPYPVQANVSVRRGSDACSAEITYPRPLPARKALVSRQMKHYVALDLGSDSMAAVYATDDGQELRMVPLQHFAPIMVPDRQPNLLWTQRGGAPADVSPRLRSRIELQENQAERTLPEWHATLDFFDLTRAEPTILPGYRQSIFLMFQSARVAPKVNTTLPNPKVMFQYGIREAFPNFRTITGEPLDLSPETAIGHLTTQVLRNLILQSPILRGIDPNEIEVILTVPNVYSVEHAENLRRTVERYARVGRVSTISESDALAYYYLSKPRKAKGATDSDDPSPSTQILTIDVGRGTTDLSLLQTQVVDGEEHVWVRARTGRSSGGGELTYLFVQFFERELKRVFREHGHLLGDRGNLGPMVEPPMSFLWVKNPGLVSDAAYSEALYAMADLVEEVKQAFGERYSMTTPASAQPAIETIVRSIMRFVEIGYLDIPDWSINQSAGIEEFRQRLHDALVVEADLGRGVLATLKDRPKRSFKAELRAMWREMLARIKGSRRVAPDKPKVARAAKERDTANLDWLGAQIRNYVQLNIHRLLIELGATVANKTDAQAFGSLGSVREEVDLAIQSIVERGRTHVVVGGQASQFGPIRRALRELFGDRVGRDIVALDTLTGQDSKDACSKGAVVYATSGHRPQNRDALHGTYGFVKVAQTDEAAQVYSVRMQELNSEGADMVRTPTDVGHYFVFTPGAFHSGTEFDDGMISRLGRFTGREFCVTYQPETEGTIRRLAVNGAPVRLGNFGELKDNIWKKVWPDQLPREPQN